MNLWIVGQKKDTDDDIWSWEFEGVFDSEEKAIKACRKDDFFIAPSKLNFSIQDGNVWEDAYYPLLETKEEGAARWLSDPADWPAKLIFGGYPDRRDLDALINAG